MNSTDRLSEELRRQAQGLPDQHPFTLEDVQSRARGIRRRRYAATGLAAAAVVAVTVPLGLAAGDRLDRTSGGPVDRPGEGRSVIEDGPTPTPTPTPTDLPRRIALTTDVEATPQLPSLAYLSGGEIHRPDGSAVEVQQDADRLDVLVPLGAGYVVGGDSGGRFTGYLDASGDVVWSEPSAGWPVVSPTGRLVAFGRGGGRTVTVSEDGTREELTTRLPDGYEVAAVTADAGSCEDGGASCTVYSNSTMVLEALTQTTGTLRRGGGARDGETIDELPALVEAASVTGRLALTVSRDDLGGLCSAVAEPDGSRPWNTCDWRLGPFSLDGRFLLGYPLEDGRGPRSLAVLDAGTGEVVREFAAQGRADVFVRQAVWDADGSVLATVWDTDHWSVLRMGTDGTLASVPADGLEGADDADAPPVFLASVPSLS